MATNALLLEWGVPIQGRESKALEVYASVIAWWEKAQRDGRIEAFLPFGCMTGNMSARTGLVVVTGTQRQIDELRVAEDWRQHLDRIALVAENVSISLHETGEEMVRRMQRYGASVRQVV